MSTPEELINKFTVVASLSLTLFIAVAAQGQLQVKEARTQYPGMAPLDQYLMHRNPEIALARSAAPESISRVATVIVLGPHGYETGVEGKNGFVCDAERSWMGPFDNNPEFWNPKVRGAGYYNPQAARSALPIAYLRTKMVLAGLSPAQMAERMKAAYAKKELTTSDARAQRNSQVWPSGKTHNNSGLSLPETRTI